MQFLSFSCSFVSIPHRYGKNANLFITIRVILRFPFLIGTVRTERLIIFYLLVCCVSIPHRYGKNFVEARGFTVLPKVSIPHRYGKNEEVGVEFLTFQNVSIPHRYGKNLQFKW